MHLHLSQVTDKFWGEYLPPNVSSILKPMDQGVLEAIKRCFRKLPLCCVLGENGDLKQFYKMWSIKDAILTSADSWNNILTA